MIKVGVVGLGVMGQHHARLYSQLGCKLEGVVDADPVRAREIGQKYGTSFYFDHHELLSKVQAVSIAVPTSLHYSVAMDFLKAGVHCLVEKPIAFSVDEACEMVETAEVNHAILAIGHIEHHNPAVEKLKEIVDAGTLGKLLIISTRRVGPFVSRITDIGVVIDSATHDIGVVKYLVGKEPVSVFSRVGSFKAPNEDYAIIVLDFGGTISCSEVNWFTPQKVRTLVATGSEGTAHLDYIEQTLTIRNNNLVQVIPVEKIEPLRRELEAFLENIKNVKKPSVDGKEGTAILKICLEACHNNYASLEELVI